MEKAAYFGWLHYIYSAKIDAYLMSIYVDDKTGDGDSYHA